VRYGPVSSRNKVTMQIQARTSRGVKSRRVGGGSNFHETFPRMNEGRRTTSSTRREPTYRRHFYFRRSSSSRFSIVFPSDSSANLVHRFARSSHFSLIDRRSQAHLQHFSRRNSSLSHRPIFLSWFDFRVSRRGFSENFEIHFATHLFFLDDKSRESSSRKCNLTVDYTRKIALDGPSIDVSTECMHSKCMT